MQSCVPEDATSSRERYPLNINCHAPVGEDRALCDRRLSEESLELFQANGGGADVLWSVDGESVSQHLQTPGPEGATSGIREPVLQRCFVASEDIDTSRVFMILEERTFKHMVLVMKPVFSWGQLAVTEHAFRHLLARLRVFTPFLRVAHTFGTKTNDKQRMRDVVYHHMQSSCTFEFCYIIRYFELNNRQRGNPWSLRQTGVYQKLQSDQCSAWVLLNLSSYINDRVSAGVKQSCSADHSSQPSPLSIHVFIITAAVRNWGMYIEHLRRRVQTFVWRATTSGAQMHANVVPKEEKSYSSRVDYVHLDDYKLLFADVQAMVSLGETLDIAKAVITCQKGVVSRCHDILVELRRRTSKQNDTDEAHALQLLRCDIQHYHDVVVAMAKTTSHITQLVSTILASRSSAKVTGSISTIRTSVSEVQSQSRQTALDTAGLLQATTKGHEDATKIKIMAQIATMFLPASLIASIFSSTIFGDSVNSTSNIGTYFAITIPLLVVTLLFLVFLEKDASLALFLKRLRS